MNESEEQALERLLQRSSPLSRAYQQLADESPSAALDQAVLAKARDAVGASTPPKKRDWQWPTLALAATVLLSFGLVMRLALQPAQHAVLPATPAAEPAELRGTLSAPQASATAQSPAAPSAMDSNAAPPAKAIASPAAAPPEEETKPVASGLARARANNEALREEDKSAAVMDRMSKERPAAVADIPESADPYAKLEAPTSATVAAPAPQDAAGGALASSPTGNRDFRADAYPGSAAAVSAPSAPKDARQKAALKKAGVKPAKEWLDEIARLRASGQTEAADREYAAFLRAYPNYPRESATPPTQ